MVIIQLGWETPPSPDESIELTDCNWFVCLCREIKGFGDFSSRSVNRQLSLGGRRADATYFRARLVWSGLPLFPKWRDLSTPYFFFFGEVVLSGSSLAPLPSRLGPIWFPTMCRDQPMKLFSLHRGLRGTLLLVSTRESCLKLFWVHY